MDEDDLSSDSSDDDYVPHDHEAVSEEEESGDEENFAVQDNEKEGGVGVLQKRTKRKSKQQTSIPSKRKGGIRLEEDAESSNATEQDDFQKELAQKIVEEGKEKQVEKEKVKSDSLWADFMKDVGSPSSKPRPAARTVAGSAAASKVVPAKSTAASAAPVAKTSDKAKVTIIKEFDFAGETVKVTKEVSADSKEAKESLKPPTAAAETVGPLSAGPSFGKRASGLGNVLGKIGKKTSISTLDKSKLDWDTFKAKEGIEEELKTFNKGRQGYLEKQDFLERTDFRQFEIEKSFRLASSSKK